MTSTVALAEVVADLIEGRCRYTIDPAGPYRSVLDAPGVVIDATRVHARVLADDLVPAYNTLTLTPLWRDAVIAYRNPHRNLVAAIYASAPSHESAARWREIKRSARKKARWLGYVAAYIGRDPAKHPTQGPMSEWHFTVGDDGRLRDLMPRGLPGHAADVAVWEEALWTALVTIDTLNNGAELVEPRLSQGDQRRLAKAGVHVLEPSRPGR